MAGITVEEFVNKIGFQVDQTQLAAAENTVNKAVNGMAGGFSWLVKSMAPLAAGFGLFEIGKYAITSAANVERLTAQFEVMLGGADKATKMIKDIQTLAASTPLTSVGVTESVKTLLAFGVAGKDAISTIRMLGDVAGGDQERLNRLSYAYGQTMTAGRLMGQDLLQYINVGFSPLKVMGDNLEKFGLKAGTTQGDLRKMMSAGQISAEMVTKAFQIATSEGGMFYQNMEKQSKTLGGLWSTMIDNIQLGLIKAITPLIPLLKKIVDFAGQIDWTPIVSAMGVIAQGALFIADNVSLLIGVLGIFAAKSLIAWGEGLQARLSSTLFATQAQTVAIGEQVLANEALVVSDGLIAEAEALKWEAFARSEALYVQSQAVMAAGAAEEATLIAKSTALRQEANTLQYVDMGKREALLLEANALEIKAIEARNVAIAQSTAMELESVAIRKEASLVAGAMYAQEARVAKIAALETAGVSQVSFAAIRTAGVGAFRSIGMAIKTALGPIGLLLIGVELLIYGYQKLKDMEKENTMAGANEEVNRALRIKDSILTRKGEVGALLNDASAGEAYWKGERGQKELAGYKKEFAYLNLREAQINKQISAAKGTRGEVSESLYGASESSMKDKAQWDEALKSVKNTKQQTVNVKNEINQHIQVDDKGDTKVSRQAMEDFTKMAIRDTFNVQFMSLSRVPA